MLIRANLFLKHCSLKGGPSLSQILDNHKKKVIAGIRSIASLEQLTEAFLAKVVEDSLVEPVVFDFERKSKTLRTETVDPAGAGSRGRWSGYPPVERTVARITIPFTGDAQLLEITPSSSGLSFPAGEVVGSAVEFDVVLWDTDVERVRAEIEQNFDLMRSYAATTAKDVTSFNETMPKEVEVAFRAKFEELSKQHAIFDHLGIADPEPEPEPVGSISVPVKPSRVRGPKRAEVTIAYVHNLFVERMTQMNSSVNQGGNISIRGNVTASAIGQGAVVWARDVASFKETIGKAALDEPVKKALNEAREAVEVAGLSDGDKADATDTLAKLKEELEKPAKDKGRLKRLWDGLTAISAPAGQFVGGVMRGYFGDATAS